MAESAVADVLGDDDDLLVEGGVVEGAVVLDPVGVLAVVLGVVLVAGSVAVTVVVLVTVSGLRSLVVLLTELESVGASEGVVGVLSEVSGVPAEPPPSTLRPPLLPPESGVPLTASIPVTVSSARAQAATAPSAAVAQRESRLSPATLAGGVWVGVRYVGDGCRGVTGGGTNPQACCCAGICTVAAS